MQQNSSRADEKTQLLTCNLEVILDIRLAVQQDVQLNHKNSSETLQNSDVDRGNADQQKAGVAFKMCPIREFSVHVSSRFIAKSSPLHDASVRSRLAVVARSSLE